MEPILTSLIATAGTRLIDSLFSSKPSQPAADTTKGAHFEALLNPTSKASSVTSEFSNFLSVNGIGNVHEAQSLRDQLSSQLASQLGLDPSSFQIQIQNGQPTIHTNTGQTLNLASHPQLNSLAINIHQLNSLEQAASQLPNASFLDLVNQIGQGTPTTIARSPLSTT